MSAKPKILTGYSPDVTRDCERVLVTLFSGIGPWRNSVFLIGGLTPRYLVTARPPLVPAHAGTGDIDIVVDLAILTNIEAYRTLEENLTRMGFQRAENAQGAKVNWRWKIKTEHGATVILEFLADDPKLTGGAMQELPTGGKITAVNIPHAALVFDLYDETEVTADRLDGGGLTSEQIRHANIVSFTCLKAFAYEHRREPKDAHDLVYCLEHSTGGLDGVIAKFEAVMAGPHREIIQTALTMLRTRFCDAQADRGYRREGPVDVARFEIAGDDDDRDIREQRTLRQRLVNDLIERLLGGLRV